LQNRHTEYDSNSTDFSLRHNFHTSSGIHAISIQWDAALESGTDKPLPTSAEVKIRGAQYFHFHFFYEVVFVYKEHKI